jgi:ZIP family zinc transporter/zinc and cadmium transporter
MLSNIIVFGLLGGLASICGAYFIRSFSGWAQKKSVYLVSFAAGVFLANAFGHLVPDAVSLNGTWFYWLLGALLLLYISEQTFIIHSCAEEDCEAHHVGKLVLFGLSFHSIIDGFAIAISFEAGYAIGVMASLAIIFHKLADGFCTYLLLIEGKMQKSKALICSWLLALVTPLGAILAYFFARHMSSSNLGGLLAATAGIFIYIGASDLLPMTHKEKKYGTAFSFALGMVFVFLLSQAL